MSLTKEVAHDLRMVTTQPTDLAVLPSWAKLLPLGFYLGFGFFLLGLTYNTFQAKIHNAKNDALGKVVQQYKELLEQDKQTTSRLVEQSNAVVRVARWIDYSPMLQKILIGIFAPLDERVQISDLQIERKAGIQPEYTLNLSFRAAQGDIGFIIKRIRDSLAEKGWQLTTVAQVYQESVTNFQGYLQPMPGSMSFESQYLSVMQDPNKPIIPPTGVSQ